MSSDVQDKTTETGEPQESELKKNFRDRLLLPVTIPLIGAILVALLGISFSRIFLAGDAPDQVLPGTVVSTITETKSSSPVFWATIITIIVLLGAAAISLAKSMRPLSFKLILSGVVALVVISGAVIYSTGNQPAEGPVPGKPTAADLKTADKSNVIEEHALGSLQFSVNKFTVKAGVVHIKYVGIGGSHQLKFSGKFDWFDLAVNAGQTVESDVKLDPGEYVIYCPIAGHENMKATVTVTP